MTKQNECYTYFKITGTFEPDEISEILGILPEKQWRIGDKRKNDTRYDFALWQCGSCKEYNVFVNEQMLNTIQPLLSKVEQLKSIKECYDVFYTLEIVPSIYVEEVAPCLAPSKEIIKFCYETDTDIDIDLYLYKSDDE